MVETLQECIDGSNVVAVEIRTPVATMRVHGKSVGWFARMISADHVAQTSFCGENLGKYVGGELIGEHARGVWTWQSGAGHGQTLVLFGSRVERVQVFTSKVGLWRRVFGRWCSKLIVGVE